MKNLLTKLFTKLWCLLGFHSWLTIESVKEEFSGWSGTKACVFEFNSNDFPALAESPGVRRMFSITPTSVRCKIVFPEIYQDTVCRNCGKLNLELRKELLNFIDTQKQLKLKEEADARRQAQVAAWIAQFDKENFGKRD